ncbi:MAG TPA: HlyD family type I secretion periplasmic adaptor subunit [Crenalkalicoccus sp.]|nr:HlyD family type I secretion periplasmic adaptor subunit [Crenalkalicoccus sp.]
MSVETPALPAPTTPGRALAPIKGGTLALTGPLALVPPNALLDAPAPRTRGPLLFGLLVVILFVGGFAAWSVFAPLAEAAIAPGVIKVEGTRRTIQHLEGGIVREILVRDGAKVHRGEVLMRLDDIQADSALETARAQRWAYLAEEARLVAELARAHEIAFPAALLSSEQLRAQDAVRSQRALFAARTANLESQVAVLQTRIEQQQGAIASAEGQIVATKRQLVLIKEEEQMRRSLTQQGLARLPDLLAVQRAAAGLEGTLQDLTGQVQRAQASIAEARRSMQQALDQRMQEVTSDLRDTRGKLAETEEKLRAAQDVVTRRDILAPEDGTIVNLRIFTVGAVVKPGDPVTDLVPDHDRLVAEVNVQPTDIDVVYPGLRSEIRLPAFKQRLVPYLHGQVTWVAADVTQNDQTRQQYYRAYVLIDPGQLAELPNVFLTPGMPVEAHVQIGQRSFFRYITQPIRDSFHRAFKEQ